MFKSNRILVCCVPYCRGSSSFCNNNNRQIMVKPIPDNVKTCLGELPSSQQVTLKGYIATLRAEIKDLQEQLRTANDPDPHAHYHGHEKCTADHGHNEHDHHQHHDDDNNNKGHDHHKHHKHDHHDGHKGDDHGCKEDHSHKHKHEHKHKEHDHDHKHHDHDHHKHHDEEEHERKHKHDHHENSHSHKKEKTTAADPMALNWNVDKMEE